MPIFFSLLVFLLILVNGWTDAPNAIAGAVSTRALSPRGAVCLAALCNLLGAVGMAMLHMGVAETVFGIAEFHGDPDSSVRALCAALLTVILWGTLAWWFGLPTSESHALISAMTGAALASQMRLDAIQRKEWILVLLGLLVTTLPACLLGFLLDRLFRRLFRQVARRRAIRFFSRVQILGAIGSALLHGAQDSQKFLGVYLLGLSLLGYRPSASNGIPLVLILLCAAFMGLGTLLGGSRIIKKIGCEMTDLDALSGSASDLASSLVLLLCSCSGIPASTTHSKSSAILGTGLFRRRGINRSIVGELLAAWGLTFPVCGMLGFLLTRLMT